MLIAAKVPELAVIARKAVERDNMTVVVSAVTKRDFPARCATNKSDYMLLLYLFQTPMCAYPYTRR